MDEDPVDWDCFLACWSRGLLRWDEVRQAQEPDVLAADWLGYPGATEERIAAAERRLGIVFPPSYRSFLRVSNGWRAALPVLGALWSVDDVGWFSSRRGDVIAAYAAGLGAANPMAMDAQAATTYLEAALEVSDGAAGDDTAILLNPTVVAPDGEWEACFFVSWRAETERYASFQALMHARYRRFLALCAEE